MRKVFFDTLSKMGRAAGKENLNDFVTIINELYGKYINAIKSRERDD